MTTILFPRSPFIYLYSGLPFFLYKNGRDLTLTSDPDFVETKDKNRSIILLRWFNTENPGRPEDPVAFLLRLREKYDRIAIFDDDDSSASTELALLPYVDLFWKKQLLRDRSAYMKDWYGNRIFSDHYHRTRGVQETGSSVYNKAADPVQLEKMRVSWHLGIGMYPLRYAKDRVADVLYPVIGRSVSRLLAGVPVRRPSFHTPKDRICQARYASKGYTQSIGYQRELFAGILKETPRVAYGFIDRALYRQEMETAAAVVSPFGWGEVCYRDFEAFQLGSVLIKPTMDHLETWPESYRPGETYVPVSWDGDDLAETIARVLDDPAGCRQMADRAFDLWADAYRHLDTRVESMLEELK